MIVFTSRKGRIENAYRAHFLQDIRLAIALKVSVIDADLIRIKQRDGLSVYWFSCVVHETNTVADEHIA